MNEPVEEPSISSNWAPFCGTWELRSEQAADGTAQQEYSAFVRELLEAEERRSTAMETRATAVIGASGAIATLLLAFAALATRVETFEIPRPAVFLVAISGALFVAAAYAAVMVNAVTSAWGLDPQSLRQELHDRWDHKGDNPLIKTTVTRLEMWSTARGLTQRKARWLRSATLLQSAALTLLAIATMIMLFAS
jgi:hypothetical protein